MLSEVRHAPVSPAFPRLGGPSKRRLPWRTAPQNTPPPPSSPAAPAVHARVPSLTSSGRGRPKGPRSALALRPAPAGTGSPAIGPPKGMAAGAGGPPGAPPSPQSASPPPGRGARGRARAAASRALTPAPLRLSAVLLRHALRSTGRAPWGPAHLRGRRAG